MLARRHPLRFTIWTLVAIWLTAIVAVGATYLIVGASESGEGHYLGYEYTQRTRCTPAHTGTSWVAISDFTPISAGETARVTHRENMHTPAVIYVWKGEHHCVREWAIDDGP